jgi:hypothetical protein
MPHAFADGEIAMMTPEQRLWSVGLSMYLDALAQVTETFREALERRVPAGALLGPHEQGLHQIKLAMTDYAARFQKAAWTAG